MNLDQILDTLDRLEMDGVELSAALFSATTSDTLEAA